MGKRSQFERIDKDFYRTVDPRAVEPLLPFLVPKTKYAEPCYGQGDLVNMLQAHGHICKWASDIVMTEEAQTHDALTLQREHLDYHGVDTIITNPPWSRPILHAMIGHFVTLKPTWLLFDAGWAYTRQSSELMKTYCTDIVATGRLKWIPGTTMSGKMTVVGITLTDTNQVQLDFMDARTHYERYGKPWYEANKERTRERVNRSYRLHLPKRLWASARLRASKAGMEFNLEQSDVVIPEVCPILGTEFEVGEWSAASLDRIDNTKGYIKGNVWVISRRANTMKGDCTPDMLLKFAEWINTNYGRRIN